MPPDGLRHRALSQDLRTVSEPDYGSEDVPVADGRLEELRVLHLHPVEMLLEGLEGDVLGLVELRRRHQDEAARVAFVSRI